MIKLYKNTQGTYLKACKNYNTGFLISLNEGDTWMQVGSSKSKRAIESGEFKLIGNNFRRKK